MGQWQHVQSAPGANARAAKWPRKEGNSKSKCLSYVLNEQTFAKKRKINKAHQIERQNNQRHSQVEEIGIFVTRQPSDTDPVDIWNGTGRTWAWQRLWWKTPNDKGPQRSHKGVWLEIIHLQREDFNIEPLFLKTVSFGSLIYKNEHKWTKSGVQRPHLVTPSTPEGTDRKGEPGVKQC